MKNSNKKKVIFFGGEFLNIDDTLKEKIQSILDNAIKNAFLVFSVQAVENEVTIGIFRSLKDFYQTDEDCTNLDDLALFTGHVEKAPVKIPIGMHPFANIMHYHFQISDVLKSYNELMKERGYKTLKSLKIISTEKTVTYHYHF